MNWKVLKLLEVRGGTAPQAGRSRVRLPVGSLRFFIHFMFPAALGSTQP